MTDIETRARELLAKHKEAAGFIRTAVDLRAGNLDAWDKPFIAALTEALARVEELEGALTPSADTKADYIGEFKFQLQRAGYDDDGDYIEWSETIFVPWDTTKDIMAKILARATLTKGIRE